MNYLEEMVDEELKRANAIHLDYFPTMEHGLFVIQEEVKEVEVETENLVNTYQKMLKDSRKDYIYDIDLARLEMFSINLISEAIQIIAMVRKYKYSNIDKKIEQEKRIGFKYGDDL